MSRRFAISVSVILLAISATAIFLFRDQNYATKPLTPKALAKGFAALGRTSQINPPTPAVLAPLKMSQPVRLAVGGLGLSGEEQNLQLGDLITVELSGTPGFALVERASLAKVLQELRLNWSGLVRAKDAVRIGKLLKVDWFLLGTEAKINGTNTLVARVVDARSGVIRDAGIFPAEEAPPQLASDLATFLRQVRQNAAAAKLHVCLAIGAFEDLSVNNRRADFPSQLRGYLTAAYRGGDVTLLERESVDTLLQEVRLDLAGLTDESGSTPPAAMQSAFWVVTGQYQSYETTQLEVEVNLEIKRVFGTSWQKSLRAAPGEPIGRQIKNAVDEVMHRNAEAIIPTRASEARIQLDTGRDLAHGVFQFMGDLVVIGSHDSMADPQLAAKQQRKLEEAVRAFKTVLLLEPKQHEAKMYLAATMRTPLLLHPDEACNYYREIIDDPVQDRWSKAAQQALVETFKWFDPAQRMAWLQSAASQTTNQLAADFYQRQMQAAEDKAVMDAGDSPKAEELAEQRLFQCIIDCEGSLHHKLPSRWWDHLGMRDYLQVVGRHETNAPRKLVELLPKMEKLAPDLEPFLVTSVLSFQLDTNTPMVAEFQKVLLEVEATEPSKPPLDLVKWKLWGDMGQIYYWCMAKTNYPLAIQLLEAKRRVAPVGYTIFDDQEKIKLGYAYLAVARWQDALDIFESYSNQPLPAMNSGPWGSAFQPIMTDKLVAFCRDQLGQPIPQDSRQFDLGKPVLCLCAPSAFLADDQGLWIGIGGRMLKLDFELHTNLEVELPMTGLWPITALCQTANEIWIGTAGDGLIEFNKASRHCRRFTEADGLLMNYVACLQATDDSLWIGYGSRTGGGLGQMDLRSRKVISFTPSLNAESTAFTGQTPPRAGIGMIVAGTDGDLWLSAAGAIRQFHVPSGTWETLSNQPDARVTCFCADSERLVEGLMVSTGARTRGALAIQNLRDHLWQNLEDPDGIPNLPNVLTMDGNNVWVGSEGAVALMDLKEGKLRKYCHVKAARVDSIQIAGGYVWVQCDYHLYRAALSAVQ